MLINAETLEDRTIVKSDMAIVGAGPAGIVMALELATAGYEVVLIESGSLRFSAAAQHLGEANYVAPQFHEPMSACTRRQLGGTSTIWGGRCLPYDPVDFDRRDYIPDSDWPIGYEEISGYFQRACDYCFCGQAEFNIEHIPNIKQKSIVPGLPDAEVLTSTLERWSLPTNFGKEYFQNLKQSPRIKLIYNLTCTEIVTNEPGDRVEFLHAQTLGGKHIDLQCQTSILAGGGVNTTRLLLTSDRYHPGGIGNHSGLLGRFYMGHVSGSIANVRFSTPPQDTVFGFDRDPDGIYLRRRFSFAREFLHQEQLPNIVAWLSSPKFSDPSHQNGVLSTAYLALSVPILKNFLTSTAMRKAAIGQEREGIYRAHLRNVFKDFQQSLTFLPRFGYGRYIAKRKIPGLFVYSADNKYPLNYHSEQVPNFNSTVSLADDLDELGMRKLNIDLRFCAADIDGVIKAHGYWDRYLRERDCGYLEYVSDDLAASIWSQAIDGFHQVGTTRMSAHPSKGVVDPDCKVHGVDNLFVASSSNFVTSGQANSTFTIVAFALKLADYLSKQQKTDIYAKQSRVDAN